MTSMLRRFLATLGFLSRLAPARVIHEADMRRSMFHLPLCGLVIGLAACAPALAGLFAGRPLVQAWLCVMLSAWLTRGLHLDGLADVMDGAGQHLNPERFWVIIKDSRSGTFGVAALVLALLGQTVLFAEVLRIYPPEALRIYVSEALRTYLPEALRACSSEPLRAGPAGGIWTALALPWVFVFGRSCAVVFGRLTRDLIRPGLGGLFLAGAHGKAVAWAMALALCPAMLPAMLPATLSTMLPAALALPTPARSFALGAALAALAALALLFPLHRLARAVGGVNGDFLGAAVVLGETAAAAGLVLAACP